MADQSTPETTALAEQALSETEREQQRQASQGGTEVAGDILGAAVDGTLGAIADGAVAVAEGAANVIGGILGGLADL